MTGKSDVAGGRDDALGKRLAEARNRAGLSQQAVADAVVTAKRGRQTVYEWEAGKASPSVEDLEKLCRLYGVTADSVLGLPEPDYAVRLAVIGKIVDNTISDDVVRRLAATASLAELEDLAAEGARALADLRKLQDALAHQERTSGGGGG